MIVRRLPENSELYHHGIKGMHWGIRRFQNPDGTLTGAGRKRKGLLAQMRTNYKMKKVRRARVEKAKEKQRQKDEQAKRLQKANEERRERAEVIKTGSAKDIQKFQNKMSNREYEEALLRIDLNQKLTEYATLQSQAKAERMAAKLETVMNTAQTVSNIAKSAANVYGVLQDVGIIKTKEKADPFEALEKKKRKMGLELDIQDLQFEKDQYKKIKQEEKKAKSIFNTKNDVKKTKKLETDDAQVNINDAKIDDMMAMMREMYDNQRYY